MQMNTYTANTSYIVYNRLVVDAPEGLTEDDINSLITALLQCTDKPTPGTLTDIMQDVDYWEGLHPDKIELYNQVTFTVKTVGREYYLTELTKN